MAYIDRDKVLKAVEKMDRLDKETKTKYEYDKEGFLLLIKSAPTEDVQEVVRCKDCKYCELTYPEKELNKEPTTVYCCEVYRCHKQPTDFCSYGKKEGD